MGNPRQMLWEKQIKKMKLDNKKVELVFEFPLVCTYSLGTIFPAYCTSS